MAIKQAEPRDGPHVEATWGVVVGARLRARRELRAWRQEDVAGRMVGLGQDWQRVTVAAVEQGSREASALELILLAGVFRRSLQAFLALEPDVETGIVLDGAEWPEEAVLVVSKPGMRLRWATIVRDVLTAAGGVEAVTVGGPVESHRAPPPEADVKAARALDVGVPELQQAALVLWKRSLAEERDARLGDVEGVPARTVQARRGHLTRQLLGELRQAAPLGGLLGEGR